MRSANRSANSCAIESAAYSRYRPAYPHALIEWVAALAPDHTLAVDCNVRDSAITHSQYAARRVKDAICDQFREKVGRRPSVDTERPGIGINLHIARDHAILSLDSSWDSRLSARYLTPREFLNPWVRFTSFRRRHESLAMDHRPGDRLRRGWLRRLRIDGRWRRPACLADRVCR